MGVLVNCNKLQILIYLNFRRIHEGLPIQSPPQKYPVYIRIRIVVQRQHGKLSDQGHRIRHLAFRALRHLCDVLPLIDKAFPKHIIIAI